MPSLSAPAAELASILIASVLYGFYLATLAAAVPALLRTSAGQWKWRADIHWVTVGASVILFLNVTMDLALAMYSSFNTLVFHAAEEGAYANSSDWQNLFKSLTGDAILIYRCWLIYGRSWTIITLPLLLWVAALTCDARLVRLQTTMSGDIEASKHVMPWGTAFWAFTLAINVLTTGTSLLAPLALPYIRFTHSAPSNTLNQARRTIVESGLLYTTSVILAFAAYLTQSVLMYPAGSFEIQSVGIAFNWIIIRRARRREEDRQPIHGHSIQFNRTNVTTSMGGTSSNFVGAGGQDVLIIGKIEEPYPAQSSDSKLNEHL
ncbi:hypothetical protein B0H17DRAFT_1196636 [Mycena rosella]|uniref:Uncharacterized protein n=1 Tax=Mycena rosella TaxID=1033263 RepID=A0AAD7DT46_MYCRO|nr:hypothetical protein B0H17DRAFT_1196636 [Mycena rosella]